MESIDTTEMDALKVSLINKERELKLLKKEGERLSSTK